MEENLKEDSQVNPLSPQQEEIQKRREAVLLRQKELQQKSSSPPWEDSIKQQPSQPIKPWQSQVQSQPQTQTSTQTSPPIGSVQPVNIPSNNFSNQPTVRVSLIS